MQYKTQQRYHFRPYSPNQTILFPQRIDKDIAQDDPVRLVSSVVNSLDLSGLRKLYKERGRSPYDPKMLLAVVIYAYMNNIYSCRKIEKSLRRDVHFIWLAGYEQPDFITINRFRNRAKEEINNIFTQLVLLLSAKGLVSLDVEYVDGTKMESKAN
ncbi:MAG: transposase, partial [Bacteroidaceae bacterium]|nr:transposase [Bacteroidaceae bacterium]